MLPISVDSNGHLSETRNRKQQTWSSQMLPNPAQLKPSSRSSRILTSPKFIISSAVTFIIIMAQVLIFHFYVGSRSPGGMSVFYSSNEQQQTELRSISEDWDCLYPGLGNIYELAQEFAIDLVLIDPDLLNVLDKASPNNNNNNNNNDDGAQQTPIVFSSSVNNQGSSISSRRSQETMQKTILHLAAINETSGGQPNLKRFYNALKENGYTMLKYDDTSKLMEPEVYQRPPHLLDDVPLEEIHSILGQQQNHPEAHEAGEQSHFAHRDYLVSIDENSPEISKVYSEFLAHLLILNKTKQTNNNDRTSCGGQAQLMSTPASLFTVIHIMVLYNYEYNPSEQWIQSSLILDDLDRHKLLAYNVHSFDFRIPIERYYIHQKRPVVDVIKPSWRKRAKRSSFERVRVFEPEGDRTLSYLNNSHLHCVPSPFNISRLIDFSTRRLSKFMKALDSARPIEGDYEAEESIGRQLGIALHFMDAYSRAYGNFSFWLTGSSLLAYYKYCELALVPPIEFMDFFAGSQMRPNHERPYDLENIVINLELGLFASEVNDSVLEDLATAHTIGVSMRADWRKSNTSIITFHLQDCPNLIFNIYPYELRKDFYQYYFITRNTMTMSHKFTKRFVRANKEKKTSRQIDESNSMHHVFNTKDLDLCWTRVDNLHPFKVPCNVFEHLRRIYII